jgi:hypothetical protein
MLYAIFWLDYQSFRRSIAPMIELLDQGEYLPLVEHAETIIRETTPDKWILQGHGTMLEPLSLDRAPDAMELGYYLLIILSTFLQPARPALTQPAYLQGALARVGWKQPEISRLIYGEKMASLLKPERCFVADQQPWPATGYWDWITPTQANHCGWLSMEHIGQLTLQLAAAQEALLTLSSESDEGLPSTNQLGEAFGKHVRQAYDEAAAMLHQALAIQQGLLIILS